jgi:hypothetical protein
MCSYLSHNKINLLFEDPRLALNYKTWVATAKKINTPLDYLQQHKVLPNVSWCCNKIKKGIRLIGNMHMYFFTLSQK